MFKKLFGFGKKKEETQVDEVVSEVEKEEVKEEKALTAICILFAIIISRPTPFCILDEIEAPLDDINVYRFGEFLKELSQETQFIAVTHRRGTMEAAEYIYGVTMQERAISKIISLKLQEAEKFAGII